MLQPALHLAPRLGKAREVLLPDTLLLETPAEPLDHPILLGRI